ncbi:hypothetical protein BXY64_4090 [Marinifilum flexuosum]|uniref:Uncharacterized protein n=1 Tax=Marinifilum flexuosum TaxID=1117708 RepID=A0A419WKZ5_9BACT|nr:hypothetical protein BXY64_4090 [Marinifilum flexuosum]
MMKKIELSKKNLTYLLWFMALVGIFVFEFGEKVGAYLAQ